MKILFLLTAIIFQIGAELDPEDQVRRAGLPPTKDTSEINAELSSLNQKKAILEKSGTKDSPSLQLLNAQISFLNALKKGSKTGLMDSSQFNRLKSQIELYRSLHGNAAELSSQLNVFRDQVNEMRSLSQGESSQLSLNKTFKGESVETSKKITVSPESKMLYLVIGGKINSGTISMTIIKPNGEKFKTIEIDATSDVNFDQRLDLDKNRSGNIGDWSVLIKAVKADGSYYMRIITR